ncbi:MAG: hypothetical protein IJE21_00065 [Alistipes sp.]|nr:hypothetical protein [Alistipes sp.]
MDLKTVRRNLIQAVELVEGWTTQSEVSAVERDLVLDKIRKAYDAIRFGGVAHEESLTRPKAVAVAPIPQPVEKPTEPESATEQESSDEPEVEFEFIVYEGEEGEEGEESEGESDENEGNEGEGEKYSDDETDADLSDGEYSDVEPADEEDSDEKESETEEPTEPIVPSEPTEKPISEEPIASEPTEEPTAPAQPQNIEQSLFGGEDSAWRRPRRRSVIMSLYDADPQPSKTEQSAMPVEPQPQPTIKPQPTSTPQPATEPLSSQPTATEHPVAEERPAPVQYAVAPKPLEEIDAEAVLGEVLMADVHTLGDTLSHAPSVADTAPVKTLRGAISVADKFMIVRELFDGNEPAFEHAIETLDAIDDFDDCMVHIVENYSWRTSSEGAKLIIDLLQRKFQQK